MNLTIVSNQEWKNRVDEDGWLCDALIALGHTAQITAWDDPNQDWSGFDGAVMRSAWGYQHDVPAFHRWLATLEAAGVPLLNPPEILRRNVYKHLQIPALQQAGLPVIPSVFLGRGDKLTPPEPTLAATLAAHFPAAARCVVKPIVSASGHNTILVEPAAVTDEQEALFQTLVDAVETVGVIVQPFVPEIKNGELALVYLGGAYSHCVRRFTAVLTDDEKGATADTPSAAAITLAEATLAALDIPPVYARIDIVETAQGPALMELELAEPFLFFRALPEAQRTAALQRFAQVICAFLPH